MREITEEVTQAYMRGYKAYYEGLGTEAIPYEHLSNQAEEWFDGYYDALDQDNELE